MRVVRQARGAPATLLPVSWPSISCVAQFTFGSLAISSAGRSKYLHGMRGRKSGFNAPCQRLLCCRAARSCILTSGRGLRKHLLLISNMLSMSLPETPTSVMST